MKVHEYIHESPQLHTHSHTHTHTHTHTHITQMEWSRSETGGAGDITHQDRAPHREC